MDVLALADLQELIYINSERTLDTVWKTSQERWMIGIDGERESQGNLCCQRDLMMMMMMIKCFYL